MVPRMTSNPGLLARIAGLEDPVAYLEDVLVYATQRMAEAEALVAPYREAELDAALHWAAATSGGGVGTA